VSIFFRKKTMVYQSHVALVSHVLSSGTQAFTHTPYWYEGFNPNTLRSCDTPRWQHSPYEWGLATPPTASDLQAIQVPQRFLTDTEVSDNSSDHHSSIGYSDSDRSDREVEENDKRLEAKLIQCILDYFGDCQGSLPSERVQNVIKKDFADLYEAVVVNRYRKKWHKFLQHCSSIFQLFTRPAQPAPDQDYCWRIRLADNTTWEEADLQEDEERSRRDQELRNRVQAILRGSPNCQSLMIDVINELNKDLKGEDSVKGSDDDISDSTGRKPRKIRAGDLKRLMRKSNSHFAIVEAGDGEDGQKHSTYLRLTL